MRQLVDCYRSMTKTSQVCDQIKLRGYVGLWTTLVEGSKAQSKLGVLRHKTVQHRKTAKSMKKNGQKNKSSPFLSRLAITRTSPFFARIALFLFFRFCCGNRPTGSQTTRGFNVTNDQKKIIQTKLTPQVRGLSHS